MAMNRQNPVQAALSSPLEVEEEKDRPLGQVGQEVRGLAQDKVLGAVEKWANKPVAPAIKGGGGIGTTGGSMGGVSAAAQSALGKAGIGAAKSTGAKAALGALKSAVAAAVRFV
jgi:hypothetical protein